MQRFKQETKERLPGQFLSLKQDKEERTFLFTGEYQKIEKPATDFVTSQVKAAGKTHGLNAGTNMLLEFCVCNF